ncbi:MAG: hypothetical protein KGZ84_04185 [Erysipelotrichia bacterium]|nr:hypothetical protein [Erysipelotrichia bacterium]MBS3972194.1 hypothetical protein [Erysipelotrichia bacterium]
MKLGTIVLIFLSLIITPLIMIPISLNMFLFLANNQYSGVLSTLSESGRFDVTTNLISIYLSSISLIVSILLVYYVQKLSKDQQASENNQYRNILYTQTCNSLKSALENEPMKISITENIMYESYKLLGVLKKEDIDFLIQIWNILIIIKSNPSEINHHQVLLKDQVYVSMYSLIENNDFEGFYSMFNEVCCNVLNRLNPDKHKSFVFGKAYSKNDELIFEHYKKGEEDFYRIFDGGLKYDCSFVSNCVNNGFAIVQDSSYLYEGMFERRLKNGVGKQYYIKDGGKDLLKDGLWIDDKFREGTAYFLKKNNLIGLGFSHFLNRKEVNDNIRKEIEYFSAEIFDGKIVRQFDFAIGYEEDPIKILGNYGKNISKMINENAKSIDLSFLDIKD